MSKHEAVAAYNAAETMMLRPDTPEALKVLLQDEVVRLGVIAFIEPLPEGYFKETLKARLATPVMEDITVTVEADKPLVPKVSPSNSDLCALRHSIKLKGKTGTNSRVLPGYAVAAFYGIDRHLYQDIEKGERPDLVQEYMDKVTKLGLNKYLVKRIGEALLPLQTKDEKFRAVVKIAESTRHRVGLGTFRPGKAPKPSADA